MTPDRIVALGAGAALIAILYAFFFGKRREVRTAAEGDGQSVEIVVAGGYRPDLIVAKRGVPLILVFDRRESSPCSDEIVLPEFGIRRELPAHARTTIRVLPERPLLRRKRCRRVAAPEVARRLRETRGGDLLIVALTGFGQEGDRRRSFESGIDHHVLKPFRAERITELLAAGATIRKAAARNVPRPPSVLRRRRDVHLPRLKLPRPHVFRKY